MLIKEMNKHFDCVKYSRVTVTLECRHAFTEGCHHPNSIQVFKQLEKNLKVVQEYSGGITLIYYLLVCI